GRRHRRTLDVLERYGAACATRLHIRNVYAELVCAPPGGRGGTRSLGSGRRRPWARGWARARGRVVVCGRISCEKAADFDFRARFDDKLVDDAVVENLDVDDALRGLDGGNAVTALDLVAGLDHPRDERRGLHIRAQRGHLELAHAAASPASMRSTAATTSAARGSAASSRCFAYGIGTSALQTRAGGASRS